MIRLEAIDPNSDYVLENPETGETIGFSGAVLLNDGFTFQLPQRSAAIWFYWKGRLDRLP